jgi:hypothetical protein
VQHNRLGAKASAAAREEHLALMVRQSQIHPIKPSSPTEYILVNGWVREEVNCGSSANTQYRNIDLVTERLKLAVRGPESHGQNSL